jgi:hypothetical protein
VVQNPLPQYTLALFKPKIAQEGHGRGASFVLTLFLFLSVLVGLFFGDGMGLAMRFPTKLESNTIENVHMGYVFSYSFYDFIWFFNYWLLKYTENHIKS